MLVLSAEVQGFLNLRRSTLVCKLVIYFTQTGREARSPTATGSMENDIESVKLPTHSLLLYSVCVYLNDIMLSKPPLNLACTRKAVVLCPYRMGNFLQQLKLRICNWSWFRAPIVLLLVYVRTYVCTYICTCAHAG